MKLFLLSVYRPLTLCLSVIFLLAACDANKTIPEESAHQNNVHVTAAINNTVASEVLYVCPMHPHVQQHGPGECPICGMTLIKKSVPTTIDVSTTKADKTDVETSSEDESTKRILYYYDPMRPDEHFDKPGQSPFMDMQLVPKYAEGDANGIVVSAAVVQNLGIRVSHPIKRDVRASYRVPAKVVADAQGQARVQARVNGWIERLTIRAVGQHVVAGEIIAEIYSPELVEAQEEMLLGDNTAGPGAQRLRRFGIADSDIRAVIHAGKASRRLPIRANVGGVVTDIGIREGSSVTPDTMIVDIAASSFVWIEAQLFPAQRLHLGKNMQARFSLPGLPGHVWRSENGSVVPLVDAATQTQAVRFSIENQDDLPLGTLLDAVIEGAKRLDVLLVPASSVIRTAQGDRLIVQVEQNRFAPRMVKIGPRYGDEIEILSGVTISERIVTSGQFLLDAEANLQSGFSRMQVDSDASMDSMKGDQP